MIDPHRIIVALDLRELEAAERILDRTAGTGVAYKVGLQTYIQWGDSFVRKLVERDLRVFLDLKFHDIPNTVAGAVEAASNLGVWMINIHASAGQRAMRAATEAVRRHPEPRPLLIAVTVLTSLGSEDLVQLRMPDDPAVWAVHLAGEANAAGLDGVVCSPGEVRAIKRATSQAFLAVTPGIRPAGTHRHDQRRTATPGEAIAAGSDYLVVGRAVTGAADPAEALQEICQREEG